jgi:hypothetical protein
MTDEKGWKSEYQSGNGLITETLMFPKTLRLTAVILMICWIYVPSTGSAVDLKTFGLRAGISDGRNDENFQQVEAFLTWSLSREWQLAADWRFGPFLETTAGLLHGGDESAFVGSAGPGITFSGFEDKIDIPLGVNATIISDHTFGDVDLGGHIQFTSHIGLNFNFTRHFMLGYRLQHMSNAGITKPNPGVNTHMLAIGYRF